MMLKSLITRSISHFVSRDTEAGFHLRERTALHEKETLAQTNGTKYRSTSKALIISACTRRFTEDMEKIPGNGSQ